MKDPLEDITPDSDFNSQPMNNNNQTSNPYLYHSEKAFIRKSPTQSCKWPFRNDPSRTERKSLRAIMDAECDRCCGGEDIPEDERGRYVRNCEVVSCPLWEYRSKQCKVHRAYNGRLRKNESLSDKEKAEVQELYELQDGAMRRVLKKVSEHCKSQLRTFIAAYGGKSRASAIKAYEVYQANFDLSEVEPLEGGER